MRASGRGVGLLVLQAVAVVVAVLREHFLALAPFDAEHDVAAAIGDVRAEQHAEAVLGAVAFFGDAGACR